MAGGDKQEQALNMLTALGARGTPVRFTFLDTEVRLGYDARLARQPDKSEQGGRRVRKIVDPI